MNMNALTTHAWILALMMGLTTSFAVSAQSGSGGRGVQNDALREKMETMAIAFLTEELDLDTESAQRFWPIYNEHMEASKLLMDQQREARKALAEQREGNPDDFNGALQALEDVEVQLARMRSEFLRAVASAFDPGFAIDCMEARKKFERQMRERLQQRMSGEDRRTPGRPGRGPGRQRR